MQGIWAEAAFLSEGWSEQVLIEIDQRGFIHSVHSGVAATAADQRVDFVIPGMPNVHSHAFQRGCAGLAEQGVQSRAATCASRDSFWSWRQVMYQFVQAINPQQMQAIAEQLYVEMLKAGYSSVGEFHYLHHATKGQAYTNRAEMSQRVIQAATNTGIAMTLLPVLYQTSQFGGQAPHATQARFCHSIEAYLQLLSTLSTQQRSDSTLLVGIAPHSLRALTPEALQQTLQQSITILGEGPVHIHIAEQQKEVQDCLAWCGQRPVAWLMENFDVNSHWCLIHATHIQAKEMEQICKSTAVVGLCPSTEANLGDGLFPAMDFLAQQGRFAIGSDSHISVNMPEELRWLEYGQRLQHQQRLVLAQPQGASVGASLYQQALTGGAQALNQPVGKIAPGLRADLVVLDKNHPALLGKHLTQLLDALIFSTNSSPIKHVMVAGKWVIRSGHHAQEANILKRFSRTVKKLNNID